MTTCGCSRKLWARKWLATSRATRSCRAGSLATERARYAPAVAVPGKPEDSLLQKALPDHDVFRMPPQGKRRQTRNECYSAATFNPVGLPPMNAEIDTFLKLNGPTPARLTSRKPLTTCREFVARSAIGV